MASCVFCKILRREVPAEVVWTGTGSSPRMAVRDVNPQAPVHVLLLASSHVDSTSPACVSAELSEMMRDVPFIADRLGLQDYRLVVNNGPGAGQQIPHLHVHILGGWDVPPSLVAGG